jgi:4-carboxymuconolactone decarboxylase
MRFSLKKASELSSESRAVAREICEGARGEVPAPLRAWLINPEFASMSQSLGLYLRFNSSLPKKLSELSILCVANFWGSPFEWETHKKDAIKAGLGIDAIDAIKLGNIPIFES